MRRLARGVVILIMVAGLGMLSLHSARALSLPRIWSVCHSGCDFTGIQQAINDPGVNNGDALDLFTSSSPFAGNVVVGKSLTIEGSGTGTATISGGGPVVTVGASGAATQPTVTLENLTILGGNSVAAAGGIVNYGTLTVQDSIITNNASSNTGATLHGGGIDNYGVLTVSNTAISGNSSSSTYSAGGGGINNAGTRLSVTGSTIRDNTATSTFSPGSIATDGVGIYNASGSSASVSNSAIYGNTAGTFTSSSASAAAGGGIYNAGILTVSNTTINGNHTDYGGGIWLQSGSLTLANSTISGNNAGNGAGIYSSAGTLTALNSTITGNHADCCGAGILMVSNSAGVSLANTILAVNSVSGGGVGPDCDGKLSDASGGHNLLGNNDFCSGLTNGINGDRVGTPTAPIDPMLDPVGLQDNGGPTQTIALLPGSPAVDTGDSSTCASSAVGGVDQRGIARPFSTGCDIGAFELVGVSVPIVAGWNLLNLPLLDFTDTSFSGLAGALNNQLGVGTPQVEATYANGRFTLYVPGYSPDGPLSSSSGVFVLSSHAGTWNGFRTAGGSYFYSAGQAVALHPGWNLVAAPYPYQGLTAGAIAAELDPACAPGPCSVKEIAVYSGGSYATYVPGGAGTNFTVPSTAGMWILMEYGETWTPR